MHQSIYIHFRLLRAAVEYRKRTIVFMLMFFSFYGFFVHNVYQLHDHKFTANYPIDFYIDVMYRMSFVLMALCAVHM